MPRPREVNVWRFALHPELVAAAEALLPSGDRERFSRMGAQESRDASAVAWAGARAAIARTVGAAPRELQFARRCRYCDSETHGKPFLIGPAGRRVDFSISHTRGRAIVAASREVEVGVDIERVTPVAEWRELARAVAWSAELGALALLPAVGAADDAQRFLRVWVRLEARAKALGSGLVPPPGEDGWVDALDKMPAAEVDCGDDAVAAVAATGEFVLHVHDGDRLLAGV